MKFVSKLSLVNNLIYYRFSMFFFFKICHVLKNNVKLYIFYIIKKFNPDFSVTQKVTWFWYLN